ncbi:MAG TPA: hypothetical protein VFC21_10020 [Bryobacteraceae bacterium]|nr:hypothetical protein [Bryobacteraceae bacterium]
MNFIGKYWNSFIHLATVLCTLFSGFLVAPPSGGSENPWFKFGKFAVAVCIGLWFVPERVWRQRKHTWRWWMVAVVFAVGSFGCFLYYTDLVDRWSVLYWRDRRVVIGETLTPMAQSDLAALQKDRASATALDLLRESAGDPTQVWEAGEIEYRQRVLTLNFLLTMLLLASSVVTVSQAAYCASRTR